MTEATLFLTTLPSVADATNTSFLALDTVFFDAVDAIDIRFTGFDLRLRVDDFLFEDVFFFVEERLVFFEEEMLGFFLGGMLKLVDRV